MPLRANTCLIFLASFVVIGSARTKEKLLAKAAIYSIDVSCLFSKDCSLFTGVVDKASGLRLVTEFSAVFDNFLCDGRSSSSWSALKDVTSFYMQSLTRFSVCFTSFSKERWSSARRASSPPWAIPLSPRSSILISVALEKACLQISLTRMCFAGTSREIVV